MLKQTRVLQQHNRFANHHFTKTFPWTILVTLNAQQLLKKLLSLITSSTTLLLLFSALILHIFCSIYLPPVYAVALIPDNHILEGINNNATTTDENPPLVMEEEEQLLSELSSSLSKQLVAQLQQLEQEQQQNDYATNFITEPINQHNDSNNRGKAIMGEIQDQKVSNEKGQENEAVYRLETDNNGDYYDQNPEKWNVMDKQRQPIHRPDQLLKEKSDDNGSDIGLSAETLHALLNIGLHFGENGGAASTATAKTIFNDAHNKQQQVKGENIIDGTDGKKQKLLKAKPPELSCNPQEKSLCEHARMCVRRENASDFECLCRKGYAGRFCQFSLFPRSCADAFMFHEEDEGNAPEIGVWQLDIDGSGPLPATHAECRANGAITLVSHNAPADGFTVRSAELFMQHNQSSVFFPISYKLFSPAHLRALIERSECCRQQIRFDCEQSPLDFKGNQTWLEIATREGMQFRQIGTQPFSCACKNKELYGCGRDELNCYCDDLSQPRAIDQAILYNKSAGVTAVYIRSGARGTGSEGNNNNGAAQIATTQEGKQRLTLGPLECSGEAGTFPNALITLRSPTARLETGTFLRWRQLELDFRTWQPDIEQMVTGWIGEADNGEMQLKISLRAGHRIELSLSHRQNAVDPKMPGHHGADGAIILSSYSNDEEQRQQPINLPLQQQQQTIHRELSLSIASQRPLNDLNWHRLLVEIFRAEIRFSIDRLNAFQPLTFPFPKSTRFAVGGDEQGNGFVGCIGNFRVDQRLVDWRSQLESRPAGDSRVTGGCPDLCQDNKCQQGARCVEHFDTESTHCECLLSRIHYGQNCEKNVNDNSSVAFLGTSGGGFLRLLNLQTSAIHGDIVFSARTDQTRALFLYEHDHLDNFVQIHLSDEYRIVLTLNNLTRILSCTVHAKQGTVFNDMHWRQFVLERDVEGVGTVRLHVDEQQCQIGGSKGIGQGTILLNNDNANNSEQHFVESVKALKTDESINHKYQKQIESEIEKYEMLASFDSNEEAILPPLSPGFSLFNNRFEPFHMLFIGGVPSAKRSNRMKRTVVGKRMPLYITDIPPLKGCIRGLLIDGEKLDLHEAIQKGNRMGIHIGCEQQTMDCEAPFLTEQCIENGGKCKIDWTLLSNNFYKQNATPLSTRVIQCDCSLSSYAGENCTEDTGLAFIGNSSLVFDMEHPRRFAFLDDSMRQTLKFAFATKVRNVVQQLATFYFEDGKEFHVLLDSNGTFLVGLFDRNSSDETTIENNDISNKLHADKILLMHHRFVGNFTDGYRHSFHANFFAHQLPLITVDGIRHRLTSLHNGSWLSLANTNVFYFGGMQGLPSLTNDKNAGNETVADEQQKNTNIYGTDDHSTNNAEEIAENGTVDTTNAEHTEQQELHSTKKLEEKKGNGNFSSESSSSESTETKEIGSIKNGTHVTYPQRELGNEQIEERNDNPANTDAASSPILIVDAMREILARAAVDVPDDLEQEDEHKLVINGTTIGDEREFAKAIEEASDEKHLAGRSDQNNNEMTKHDNAIMDNNNQEKQEEQHLPRWWPTRSAIKHFQGIISNVYIEFERVVVHNPSTFRRQQSKLANPTDHNLRFMPIYYYLQGDLELLHRSVRLDPSAMEINGKLVPSPPLKKGTSGQFYVPTPAPVPVRNVHFPVWEAPLQAVPFYDGSNEQRLLEEAAVAAMLAADMRNRDAAANDKLAMGGDGTSFVEKRRDAWPVWLVSFLLILLLVFALLLYFCQRLLKSRRAKREDGDQKAESGISTTTATIMQMRNPERQPMLESSPLTKAANNRNNGSIATTKIPPSPPLKPPRKELENVLPGPGAPLRFVSQRQQLSSSSASFPSPPPLVPITPVPTPKMEQIFYMEPAEVKQQAQPQQPKSILRNPGAQRRAPPLGVLRMPSLQLPEENPMPTPITGPTSAPATALSEQSSSGCTYFTARDNFLPSGTSSFVSLEQPTPPLERSDEEVDEHSLLRVRDFDEHAPELMDECTRELNNGIDGLLSTHFSTGSSTQPVPRTPPAPPVIFDQNGTKTIEREKNTDDDNNDDGNVPPSSPASTLLIPSSCSSTTRSNVNDGMPIPKTTEMYTSVSDTGEDEELQIRKGEEIRMSGDEQQQQQQQ